MPSITPLFSVIIPVHNGEKYLAAAIQSVLNLDYEPIELIVVDDGSTDATEEIIRSFAGRLHYFRKSNGGPAAARNLGLLHTHGDLIGFLDADDLWTENIITRGIAALLSRPEVDIVQGQIQEIKPVAGDANGTAIEYFEKPYSYINIGSALYRKEVFAQVGGFDETLRFCEDFDWFWRAFDARIVKLRIDEVTLLYRIHAAGMTHGVNLKEINMAKVYKKAIERRRSAPDTRSTAPVGFPTLVEYFGSRTHLIPAKTTPNGRLSTTDRRCTDAPAPEAMIKTAIQRIQIFGERCSGTNYLECLISENLKHVQIRWDFGWKHFFSYVNGENTTDCLFVIIYRNPFSWLSSLHGSPWHVAPNLRGLDFSDFIRKEWWCIWDEQANKSPDDRMYGTEMAFARCPETHERFINVIQMRTAKIRDWESLRRKIKNSIYIKYEDLSTDPEGFIKTISEKFQLGRTPSFKHVRGYKGSNSDFVPATYDAIKEEDLHYIVNQLDVKLEESIGYDVKALAGQLSRCT